HVGVERTVHRERTHRADADRIAVRRSLGECGVTDVASSAWPVVDDHLPAQRGCDRYGELSRPQVIVAARRIRHDDRDRLYRILKRLRVHRRDEPPDHRGECNAMKHQSGVAFASLAMRAQRSVSLATSLAKAAWLS